MELIRYQGDLPTVKEVPVDYARVEALVERASQIRTVTDDESFALAKRIAGELKAMEDEILVAKKYVKNPIRALENAIEQLAKEINQPLVAEKVRIAQLMGAYIEHLEAMARERERKRALAAQLEKERSDREIYEARKAQEKAEAELRVAKDEITRAQAEKEKTMKELALAQAQLSAELAAEAAQIGQCKLEKPKVVGGRVEHSFKFKLIDVRELLKGGFWQCVRFELDHLGCNDVVKVQLERNPDREPTIPGVEITRQTKVHMRAASRIE
jgi:hypothetical protein